MNYSLPDPHAPFACALDFNPNPGTSMTYQDIVDLNFNTPGSQPDWKKVHAHRGVAVAV